MRRYEIALRGFLMGLCDIVPGVSGGTIALITGIYARFIAAVDATIACLTHGIWKKRGVQSEDLKEADMQFLLLVLMGLVAGLFLGATVMGFILKNYLVYAVSFFVGLIIASSWVIYEGIGDHHIRNIAFGIIGFLVGASLAFISPQTIQPTLPFLFLAGFLAISAMFLPGVSGAFVLLILGVYPFMISLLKNPLSWMLEIASFALGALVGAALISKLIHRLFEADRHKTLYALLGLVLGTLSIPLRQVAGSLEGENTFAVVVLAALGGLLVFLLRRYADSEEDSHMR